MSKRCVNCGAEVPDNAEFCDKCGVSIKNASPKKNYCANCGTENELGAKFCLNCGNLIDEAKKPQVTVNTNPSKPQKMKKWPFVLGIIVVLVAFFLIIGGKMNPVETVKNGCLPQYSSTITIEEALNNRFENGEWSSSESTITDDAYNVFFTGYDPITEMDWTISFYLEGIGDNNYLINVDNISAGGDIEYDPTNLYYLMSYVYTGNLDEYYNDMGAALWDAMFSYY